MKTALFGAELLSSGMLQSFLQEHNIAKVIVSAKQPCAADLDCESIVFQEKPEYDGHSFRPIDHTLIVFDTRTGDWKRYYFNLFSIEETDLISVLAENINRSIDRYAKR